MIQAMSVNFDSSLINLGELSKSATVLVEKISEAVDGFFNYVIEEWKRQGYIKDQSDEPVAQAISSDPKSKEQ